MLNCIVPGGPSPSPSPARRRPLSRPSDPGPPCWSPCYFPPHLWSRGDSRIWCRSRMIPLWAHNRIRAHLQWFQVTTDPRSGGGQAKFALCKNVQTCANPPFRDLQQKLSMSANNCTGICTNLHTGGHGFFNELFEKIKILNFLKLSVKLERHEVKLSRHSREQKMRKRKFSNSIFYAESCFYKGNTHKSKQGHFFFRRNL